MHAHNVFFSLKDNSDEAVAHLIAESKKYLAVIPGITSFACGSREATLVREVNDRDFDISIHILFESKEAHDTYQISPAHNEYVARNEDNWAGARVFDTAIK
jgi:heme-degrading monooxygenase HmoA